MKKIILLTIFIFILILINSKIILADECVSDNVNSFDLDKTSNCINQLNGVWGLISKANQTNKSTLLDLQKRVNALKNQLEALSNQLDKKEKEINKRNNEFDLEYAKLSKAVRSFYIQNYYPATLTIILGSNNALDIFRLEGMYSYLSRKNRNAIIDLVMTLGDLQKEKVQLSEALSQTDVLKKQVDEKANFLAGEVAKASAYEQKLQTQIAKLSARQQDILTQRLANLNISRSAASIGRCDSDLTNGRDPGFSPKFGVFTYGVPNRVGLNQYGAYGRAKAGQNYDQILRAYYNFDDYQTFDGGTQINVEGYGSFSIDDYVKRIYEVPGDWPAEVLKAQAIAARSYGLTVQRERGSICTTESCQVFKPDPKGGAWDQAVNDTAGKVMVQGGNSIKAWFSSTHGGYVFSSGEIGWNNTSWTKHAQDASGNIGSFSDLQNNSYDKESPWFYCDWGSRAEYNKTAWLKPDELADIVNVIILAEHDSSIQEHLYQTDNPPSGTDTWSADRVKEEMRRRNISPVFNNIDSVSVSADWGGGRTTSVNVSGDGGSKNFDGAEFKNFFNLRAPATIQIVGPLFNVEKR